MAWVDKSVLAGGKWMEDIYKYYGMAPYWTEEGSEQIEASGSE